jgi:hypothetical protein
MSFGANSVPVTAGRKTVLLLDRSDPSALDRPAEVIRRTTPQIARYRPKLPAGAQASQNVALVGDAFILKWHQAELAQVQRSVVGGAIGAAEANLAQYVAVEKMARQGTDLPWTTPSAGLTVAGFPAFIRRVPRGVTSPPRLTADQAAVPGPAFDAFQSYPVDRILAGKVTYQPNCPFMLRYETPHQWEGSDVLFRFYFGGLTPIVQDGFSEGMLRETGGAFCLELRGSGTAALYEAEANDASTPWRRRFEFRYAEPHAGSRLVETLGIIPHANNRIGLFSAAGDLFAPGFALLGLVGAIAGVALHSQPATLNVFHDLPAETGHLHTQAATGPGIVRVDQRQDLRSPFSIIRCSYPSLLAGESGYIVDAPFAVSYPLPAGTPMELVVDAFYPPGLSGTLVNGWLYDADTFAPLALDTLTGKFLSNANQRRYYAVLQLTSGDGLQTPVLYGYHVRVSGLFRQNFRIPRQVDIDSVDITGPDTTPDHEQGTATRKDIRNDLAILRTRDRIRASLSLVGPGGAVISHLFEGETLQPEGNWRGKPGMGGYPSAEWRDFDNLRLVGLWARIADQFSLSTVDFSRDVAASTGAQRVPWKVTDILRELFHNSGFDDTQLDIPDLPVRLWPGPAGPSFEVRAEDYILTFGTDLATAIRKLSWDYLGMVILWDPNAGPSGMWRLIRNPTPPYTRFLARFHTSDPGPAGRRLPHVAAGYPAGTTFVTHFDSWIKAPEVNIVTVRGMLPHGGGQIEQVARNENSISNPAHPDYLGRAIPVVFPPDPTLNSQSAVDWATRIIYDAAAHAQKWFSLQSPLLLVTDGTDPHQVRPRPLRINDLVLIHNAATGDVPALVRSCNPNYRTDMAETMTLEGQFLVW